MINMKRPEFNLRCVSYTLFNSPTPCPAPTLPFGSAQRGVGEKKESGDLPAASCRQIPEPFVFLSLPIGPGGWVEKKDKTEILISGFVMLR
jgi:hypothetical protein